MKENFIKFPVVDLEWPHDGTLNFPEACTRLGFANTFERIQCDLAAVTALSKAMAPVVEITGTLKAGKTSSHERLTFRHPGLNLSSYNLSHHARWPARLAIQLGTTSALAFSTLRAFLPAIAVAFTSPHGRPLILVERSVAIHVGVWSKL